MENSISNVIVENLSLRLLRNDEHFQFHTEVIREINLLGADLLGITSQFNTYVALFRKEDDALKKIVKSIYTNEIHDENIKRGDTFLGMVEINKAALRHFNEDVKTSAKNLKVVFDTYGNVTRKPLNEETSAITNLLQDLRGRFAADVAKVGIGAWVNELERLNISVAALIVERYNEANQKSDIVMKTARANVNDAYRAITKRVEALRLLNEEEPIYGEFIHKLNVIVEKYKNILAVRTGKAAAKKK